MVKGVLVGLGIFVLSLCSIIIPIAHFVTVPGGPFFAGFIGIGHVKDSPDSYGVKGLKYGSFLGGVLFVIAFISVATFIILFEPRQKFQVLLWFGVAVFTLYTGSMATLGAMYSSMRADRKPAEAEEVD